MTTIKLGTRGSRLALWQAHHVADRLRALGEQGGTAVEVEIITISTKGDRILDKPLADIGGKGLFVKEIEVALLNGEIDLAVHSLKDLPAEQPAGLVLRAYPQAAAPEDALCGRMPLPSLDALPEGARVGTGSVRRQAQLRRLRPDVRFVGLRGNVETRLSRRFEAPPGEEEPLDAVILAKAGLERLGLWESGYLPLGPPEVLPAVCQGVLAIQVREDDEATSRYVDMLNDARTLVRVAAERACLAGIEGNCHTPFAVYATLDDEGACLRLDARLFDDDGERMVEEQASVVLGDEPLGAAAALGAALASRLLEGRDW